MLIAAIFYTLTTISMVAVCLSYGIAYTIKKSSHILALIFVFIFTAIITGSSAFHLWAQIFGISEKYFPYMEARAILMLVSTLFLLFETWKEQESHVGIHGAKKHEN